MTAQEQNLTIQLLCRSGTFEATRGQGTIKHHSASQRFLRATGLGLAGLILTALSALIPIVHFFAVPFGLLVALLLVMRALRQGPSLEEASLPCPACHQAIAISSRPLRFPFTDVCESCRRAVSVERA